MTHPRFPRFLPSPHPPPPHRQTRRKCHRNRHLRRGAGVAVDILAVAERMQKGYFPGYLLEDIIKLPPLLEAKITCKCMLLICCCGGWFCC